LSAPRTLEVDIVIPARNEAAGLAAVLRAIPPRLTRSVVVVDNGSTDATPGIALDEGAIVVREPRVGYGAACLRGIAHVSSLPRPPDVVVFMDGSGADDPADLPQLLRPLRENLFDLVVGSRVLGHAPLKPGEWAGRLVATGLIRAIYGHRYTDLSSFRAVRYPALIALGMSDPGYGFLVEMQVKALKTGLRVAETPVSYRPRPRALGARTRVKETVGSSAMALYQIFRHSTTR
jgi:glycosyltransferase involved in cell wall biosynthesis